MADAVAVTDKILEIAFRNGDLLTPLKVQKLLYYAQAWYMVDHDGEKLFDDEIQAWQYGPVVPSVYETLSKYGRSPITDFIGSGNTRLDERRTEFLESFCEEFLCLSATQLVKMTHSESPWKSAWNSGSGTVIDTEQMREFYERLEDEADARAGEKAWEEFLDGDGKTYTLDEMCERYGI